MKSAYTNDINIYLVQKEQRWKLLGLLKSNLKRNNKIIQQEGNARPKSKDEPLLGILLSFSLSGTASSQLHTCI